MTKQLDSPPAEPAAPEGVVELMKAFMEWLNTTRIMRAYLRYQNASSNLLAGGIAYTALFSMAGIVTLIIMTAQAMIFAFPLTSHTIFQDVNQWIPGAIRIDGQPGLIDPAAIATPSFTWGTLVALVVSIMAGIRVVAALRVSIQTVFGLPQRPGAGWKNALRDACMFLALCLGGILASVLGSGSIVVVRALQRRLPLALPVPPGLINAGAFVLTSVLTTLILAFTLRYLALVRAPRRDLWIGTGTLGFLSTALQMSGAYLAASVPPRLRPVYAGVDHYPVGQRIGPPILVYVLLDCEPPGGSGTGGGLPAFFRASELRDGFGSRQFVLAPRSAFWPDMVPRPGRSRLAFVSASHLGQQKSPGNRGRQTPVGTSGDPRHCVPETESEVTHESNHCQCQRCPGGVPQRAWGLAG